VLIKPVKLIVETHPFTMFDKMPCGKVLYLGNLNVMPSAYLGNIGQVIISAEPKARRAQYWVNGRL